jgi:glc operon protein GlcG
MNTSQTQLLINKLFDIIETLVPNYTKDPSDQQVSNGNVAVCLIDESGMVYGKMFGTNKPRCRQSYKVAWAKASQVWLTGIKTGDYERMVFNNEVPENANGIENPDLIGWVGGQPLTLKDGTKLSAGFSGFRGITDIDIMVKALAIAES